MNTNNKRALAICSVFFLSTLIVLANDPEKNPPKKEVEKIEVKVNDKTHIVYVNMTMINKFTNSNDSSLSSVVVFPMGQSEGVTGEQWNSYMLNIKVE